MTGIVKCIQKTAPHSVSNDEADVINIHVSMFRLSFTNYGSLWALQTAAPGRTDATTPRYTVERCWCSFAWYVRPGVFFFTSLVVH